MNLGSKIRCQTFGSLPPSTTALLLLCLFLHSNPGPFVTTITPLLPLLLLLLPKSPPLLLPTRSDFWQMEKCPSRSASTLKRYSPLNSRLFTIRCHFGGKVSSSNGDRWLDRLPPIRHVRCAVDGISILPATLYLPPASIPAK